MKPNIAAMIEGMEDGETVPSISGKICGISAKKVKGKDELRQYVILSDGEMDIQLRIDNPKYQFAEDSMQKEYVITSSNTTEGIKGLTYGTKDDQPMLIVGVGAQITEAQNKVITVPKPEKKDRRLSEFEQAANSFIDAKLFLYNYVKERVLECQPDYPVEHLPAFTTSVFMDLQKSGVSIPTCHSVTEHDNDKDHKQATVVKTEEKKKPAASSKSGGGWRDFVHPTTGKTLGSVDIETLKEKFTTWYYINVRSTLSPKSLGLYDALQQCFEEIDHTPKRAAGWYLNNYVGSYPAEDAKKGKIIAKIKTIASDYFDEDDEFMSDDKAIQFIKNFKEIFEEAIK